MTTRPPTARFSDRVDNYVRYRPSYAPEVLAIIEKETGLRPPAVVAPPHGSREIDVTVAGGPP